MTPKTTNSAMGPPSISVLRAAPGAANPDPPQAVRVFHSTWTDEHLRNLAPGSVITRCLTIAIPSYAAGSTYALHDWLFNAGVGYGTDLTDQFLLTTPWDTVYSINNLDLYAQYSGSPSLEATGYGPRPVPATDPDRYQARLHNAKYQDALLPSGWGIFYYTGRISLTERGKYKVREMIGTAAELWQTRQLQTEIELGNELNLYSWQYGSRPDPEDPEPDPAKKRKLPLYSDPPVLGVPLMPTAYASLFYEVCKIASEPQFLVFDTPSGRIPILSGGFAQYVGDSGDLGAVALCYKWGWENERNPFHPDLNDPSVAPSFPAAIRLPQENPNTGGPNPDRRYVWDWLDAYYHNVHDWDGGAAGYPGAYRGTSTGKRPSGVIDDLDGIAFHLYIVAGVTYHDENNGDPVDRTDPSSARQAFRRSANQFCRTAGSHEKDAVPPADWPGFENNGGASYPAYYRELPCSATEFSFIGLDRRQYVADAYAQTVDYYQSYQAPTGWPQTRLHRIYKWDDDPWTTTEASGLKIAQMFDALCATPGITAQSADGTGTSGYLLHPNVEAEYPAFCRDRHGQPEAFGELFPAGDYHRSLVIDSPTP